MGDVLLFLAVLSLCACAAVGVLVFIGRRCPAPLPAEYVRYRPGLQEHVVIAESAVRTAYRDLAPLYDTPTLSGPPSP